MPNAKSKRTPARTTAAKPPVRKTARPAPAAATPAAAPSAEVMDTLRALLLAYGEGLIVQRDEPGAFELATTRAFRGKPMFFGAVAARKDYVSFHLMPIYVFPELLEGISPDLRSKLSGKSCFNFRTLTQSLVTELAGLTVAGLDLFRKADLA